MYKQQNKGDDTMKPTFILLKNSTSTPFFFVVPPLDLKIESEQDTDF